MKPRSHLDISEWDPNDSIMPSLTSEKRPELPAQVVGLLSSVFVHGIVFAVLFGFHLDPIIPPPITSAKLFANRTSETLYNNFVLIQLPPVGSSQQAHIRPTFSFAAPNRPQLVDAMRSRALATVSSVNLLPDTLSVEANNASDVQRGMLAGIYSNQMKARIERIWKRPRIPVDGNTTSAVNETQYFHCEVEVRQDDKGNVLEVLLPNCNGSWQWQRSLVLAIQHSSPLPAPPDRSVFSPSVTLTFMGYNYTSGMPADEYEPLVVNER